MKTRVRAQGPWGPRDWMGQPHMPAISNVGSWSNPMWMEWTMRSKGSSDSRPMRLTMSSLEARKRTPRRAGIEQPAGGLGEDGPELVTTAQAFLDADGSLNAAAAATYVHRNTMLYRLKKIEKLTGVPIRELSGQVLWVLALRVERLRRPAPSG